MFLCTGAGKSLLLAICQGPSLKKCAFVQLPPCAYTHPDTVGFLSCSAVGILEHSKTRTRAASCSGAMSGEAHGMAMSQKRWEHTGRPPLNPAQMKLL